MTDKLSLKEMLTSNYTSRSVLLASCNVKAHTAKRKLHFLSVNFSSALLASEILTAVPMKSTVLLYATLD
jgi:hypothetical protein